MKQLNRPLKLDELKQMAANRFGSLVKGVVDIEKKVLVLDAQMHADEEQFLLKQGSKQADLWGINLYPEKFGTADFVEFDSMINLRPHDNNLSRGVESPDVRGKIIGVVQKWITA